MEQQGASGQSGTATLSFLGNWKITEMELWDQDYVNLVVQGFLEFDEADGEHITGGFQFGTVSGGLHAYLRQVGDETFIEWSWEGRNDNDPGCGRGWAKIVGDDLTGRIYVHLGDDSAFAAKRQTRPRVASRGRKARRPRFTRL